MQQALIEAYKGLYGKLINMPSSCFNLPIQKLLNSFILDHESEGNILNHVNHLDKSAFEKGVLLEHRSGLGLYTLGPMIANAWAESAILSAYKAVVLFPIERLHLISEDIAEPVLNNFLGIWGATGDLKKEDVLIVISGHSGSRLRTYTQQDDEAARQKSWLSRIASLGLHYVIIAEGDAQLTVMPDTTLPVTLKPFDLSVTRLKGDKHYENKPFTLSAKAILRDATLAIEQTLFVKKNDKAEMLGIETTENWHQEILKYMDVRKLCSSLVTVPYVYEAVSAQHIITEHAKKLGIEIPDSAHPPEAHIYSLTQASHWFSAAVMHTTEKKRYACYQVGRHIVARNLGNHYVSAIEPPEAVGTISTTSGNHLLKDVSAVIAALLQHKDYSTMSASEIKAQLLQEKKIFRAANSGAFSDESHDYLKDLINFLKQEDPETKKFVPHFSKKYSHKLAYHMLQAEISKKMHGDNILNMTQLVRAVLKGDPAPFSELVTAMAATFLSETNRYTLSFLTTLCLLDLIEDDADNEQTHWDMMFAHPDHSRLGDASLKDAMLSDISHILGGYQVMSHGNSFHHAQRDMSDSVGVHWVDYKASVILMRWASLNYSRDQQRYPHITAELVRMPANDDYYYEETLDAVADGVGHEPIAIFDAFSRRLGTLEYMLVSQQLLSVITPKYTNKENFQKWVYSLRSKESFYEIYRMPLRLQKTDPKRVAFQAYPGELLSSVCGYRSAIEKEDNSFLFMGREGVKIGEFERLNMHNSNDFFRHKPLRARKMMLENCLRSDPYFFELYFFYAEMMVNEFEVFHTAISLLLRLKERIDHKHRYYDDYFIEASNKIDEYVNILSQLISIFPQNPIYRFKRAEISELLEKPDYHIAEDYEAFLRERDNPEFQELTATLDLEVTLHAMRYLEKYRQTNPERQPNKFMLFFPGEQKSEFSSDSDDQKDALSGTESDDPDAEDRLLTWAGDLVSSCAIS